MLVTAAATTAAAGAAVDITVSIALAGSGGLTVAGATSGAMHRPAGPEAVAAIGPVTVPGPALAVPEA